MEQELPLKHRQILQKMAERPDQMGYLIRSLTRMEQTIQDRLNELSTLLKTSAAVVSSLDSKTVLERILEQVEYLLDVEKCAIVALDEKQGVFRAQASRGLSQLYTEQISIDPNEPQSVTMRAIRSGEPIQISDTEKDLTYTIMRLRGQAEGYRSVLGVPLNTQHAPPSALLVYKPTPHVFTQREINLLTSFANHAAMAIENASLYARSDMRLKEQTRRLEALIQSMQDGLILENLAGQVLYANRRISELTDLPPEEISGAHVNKLMERLLSRVNLASDEKEKLRNALEANQNGSEKSRVEFSIRDARSPRYYRLQMFDVTDANGMPIGRGRILRDITVSKEVDRMKSSLISTVSHELRTPLAAIKGYTTTLLAEDVEWAPKTQQEFLSIISAETDRLSDLVNDLLDMSKIETGNLSVTKEECRIEELIVNASKRSQPPPGERLKINLPPDLPPCNVDPRRIEVVLRNLIENASKYADDGSPIVIRATSHGGKLIVYVEDEGPGIPPELHEKVFESFFRAENGLNRSTPGAGIGLTISQGFVRAHGGDIWLEPRSKGTCIAFSIPLNTNGDRISSDHPMSV
jgi:PAS domain S-box-containing protein